MGSGDCLNKVCKKILLIILIFAIAFPCVLSPTVVNAENKTAKIHSLIPNAERYYPGIEKYIADCLRKNMTDIDITAFGVPVEDAPHVLKSAVFTNPDIFYVDASFVRYKYDSSGIVHYINPIYIVSKSKIADYKKRFNKAVNSFLSVIDDNLSDFRKALLIHDKMIVNYKYKSSGDISYTAYGAIVNKSAVCEGYTRAYCYLLSKVGIESKCINNERKSHCWNYIKLGDKWYHVDVTSDDPMPDTCGYVSHKYFLVSDSKLSSYKSNEHTGYKKDITYSSKYKCDSTKFNSSFFRNIKSEIVLINNTYYFINNKYKGKKNSAFIERKNNKNKTIMLMKEKWYNDKGQESNETFSKLCVLDGYIYFNSKRNIYRYKPNNKKIKKLFTMPGFWSNDFYGIKRNGRYIVSNKKKSSSVSAPRSKILYIRKDKSVFQLPFIRKNTIALKKRQKYTFTVYRGTGKAKYRSSNNRIAKVNSKGVVTAKKKGICTITAIKNNRKFKLKVRIYR